MKLPLLIVFIIAASISKAASVDSIPTIITPIKSIRICDQALNSTSPLLIVDGKINESSQLGKIDVKSIESVTVLKGLVIISSCNCRTENGVIVIKTKACKVQSSNAIL